MGQEVLSRERLRGPIILAVSIMWIAAGAAAIWRDDFQIFFIATGPFGVVLGYLFGLDLVRRAANGRNGGSA